MHMHMHMHMHIENSEAHRLKLKEMSHGFHLLMEYPDDKNILLTPSVKNDMSLVIVTANLISKLLALIPHEW